MTREDVPGDDRDREIAHLRARNRKLAGDRAYFQLILRLIERLDPLAGVDDMLRKMLFTIVESIGGTNIKVYYWKDEELHYQDILGTSEVRAEIDDPDVAHVRETHRFMERRSGADEGLLRSALPGSYTWTFPLLVGDELVGIVQLEHLHVHGASLGRYLPAFFSHAALLLQNELRNAATRRSEAALRVATERLRLATEAGLVGVWDWDVEHDVLSWHASMNRLYGLEEGAFGGAYGAWLRAVHPDDRPFVDAEIQAALRGEREYGPEFRVVWPDGTVRHLQAASRTFRDASGRPLRMVGINYDLTERERAEAAQRRLNRELRALSRCSEALLRASDERALLDQICRIVCDEAGYRMTWVGYADRDEARTVRPVAWAGTEEGYLAGAEITWADVERGRGPSGVAIRTGESVALQDFASDPRGAPWREAALRRGYRSSIALPLKDRAGRPFGVLCIYSTEVGVFTPDEQRLLEELAGDLAFGVTALRARADLERAERERTAHLETLRESEARLARAERMAHVGYWEVDLATGAIHHSEEAYAIQGLSPDERFADPAQFRARYEALIHPDDRAGAARALEVALAGGARYDLDYRVLRPGGEVRFIHSRADVMRDEAGRPRRILGTIQDVTERRRAEDEVRELNQRLEERVAARTEELAAAYRELESFAYSVSHDLRAPLRAIDGFRALLERRIAGRLDEQGERYLRAISDAARRMGQLIDDLLSFSRMGRKELACQQVELGALVEDVVAELTMDPADRRVHWRIAPLPTVRGDRAMLRVVLVNLLSNALKFTRGRERAEIEVGSDRSERGEAVVFVRDNGVGFDMAHADRLFGVFQRLHRAEDFEGTGIGLANVRRIVARHGGRTWAQSAVGSGATFYFSLPA